MSGEARTIKINGDVYDIPTKQASAITNAIVWAWSQLGRPKDPFTESGKKLMNVIISTWEDTYPRESAQWYADRREYQKEELSTRSQVHNKTGRSLASYPYYIYVIMKKLFPSVKLADRKTVLKIVKHYPMFRMANKA